MDEVTKAINHFSALIEDQNGKLDAVLEAVGDISAQGCGFANTGRIARAEAGCANDQRVTRLEAA